jgi:hypothetical protein
MKDTSFFIPALNGGGHDATATVKEWAGLSEYEQKDIAETLATL